MKIDKRNYEDIAYVLNLGIESIYSAYLPEEKLSKNDICSIKKASKLVDRMGYKSRGEGI